MNRSGYAVGVLSRYFDVEPSNILVVLDDVNLSLGRLRARPDGADGGHNGLQSVILSLGTKEFPRVRMGVGRGAGQRDLSGYVLTRFADEEVASVNELIIRTADAVELFIKSGITPVMNRFNSLDRATEVTDEEV
jgi:PTH1 family peptidyl-tRNA hydrolase